MLGMIAAWHAVYRYKSTERDGDTVRMIACAWMMDHRAASTCCRRLEFWEQGRGSRKRSMPSFRVTTLMISLLLFVLSVAVSSNKDSQFN
jgi:hypothetical protein